jgi:hypothetical protein
MLPPEALYFACQSDPNTSQTPRKLLRFGFYNRLATRSQSLILTPPARHKVEGVEEFLHLAFLTTDSFCRLLNDRTVMTNLEIAEPTSCSLTAPFPKCKVYWFFCLPFKLHAYCTLVSVKLHPESSFDRWLALPPSCDSSGGNLDINGIACHLI